MDEPVTFETAPSQPLVPAVEFMSVLSSAEPNAPGGRRLADLLDDLSEGFLAYAEAMDATGALLRAHQPDMVIEAGDCDLAARGLGTAGLVLRSLAPAIRGQLPVLPWLAKDAPVPTHLAGRRLRDEVIADAQQTPGQQDAESSAVDTPVPGDGEAERSPAADRGQSADADQANDA